MVFVVVELNLPSNLEVLTTNIRDYPQICGCNTLTIEQSPMDVTDGSLNMISESVIGGAMAVLNELKPGLDEKVYENALVLELRSRGHQLAQQERFPVYYQQHKVGELIPDLIVDRKVIVDSKVVENFNQSHVAQMLGYLTITQLELALLVSFKESKLKWKRVAKSL